MSSGRACVCVCVYPCVCVLVLPLEEEKETMQVKLTGNSSDRRTNGDGTHAHLVYKNPPSFPGTSSSTSNKSESELQSSQLSKKKNASA